MGTSTITSTESFKSWEESYQLQLALALRLTSQAASANDPNFLGLELEPYTGRARSHADSPEAVSHRFWVNGSLSIYDRIPDGFYVVLIDRFCDPALKELIKRAASLSNRHITRKDAVNQLAHLVCNLMGGTVTSEEEPFGKRWTSCVDFLKRHLNSVVLPIGSMSVGLCVHRALLFKVLADFIDLPCRIAKGCKYCSRDIASSCLVEVDNEREYVVDLVGNPGALSKPDASLDFMSSILVSSPLSRPKTRPILTADDCKACAKLYFSDCQQLSLVFDETFSGTLVDQNEKQIALRIEGQKKNLMAATSDSNAHLKTCRRNRITHLQHQFSVTD